MGATARLVNASASTATMARPVNVPYALPTAMAVAAASSRNSSPTKPPRPTLNPGMPSRRWDVFATWVPVAPTAPSKNAPLVLTCSSARATTSAVVSATTPLVSASASRVTSVPSARARPSSRKLFTTRELIITSSFVLPIAAYAAFQYTPNQTPNPGDGHKQIDTHVVHLMVICIYISYSS